MLEIPGTLLPPRMVHRRNDFALKGPPGVPCRIYISAVAAAQ
jgi:hypothetical protein